MGHGLVQHGAWTGAAWPNGALSPTRAFSRGGVALCRLRANPWSDDRQSGPGFMFPLLLSGRYWPSTATWPWCICSLPYCLCVCIDRSRPWSCWTTWGKMGTTAGARLPQMATDVRVWTRWRSTGAWIMSDGLGVTYVRDYWGSM